MHFCPLPKEISGNKNKTFYIKALDIKMNVLKCADKLSNKTGFLVNTL